MKRKYLIMTSVSLGLKCRKQTRLYCLCGDVCMLYVVMHGEVQAGVAIVCDGGLRAWGKHMVVGGYPERNQNAVFAMVN